MLSNVTSFAGSAGSVAQGAASTAQSSIVSGSYMGMMQAQNQDAISNSLKTAQMSQELSLAQALGKFIKAAGDAVKGMAP